MTLETRYPIDLGQMVRGVNVVLAGILFWIYQQGHLSLTTLLSFWPAVLIGIGLSYVVDRERPDRLDSWGLVLAGGLLLAGNHLTPESHSLEIWLVFLPIRVSWPLLLVVVGGYIAWRELAGKRLQEEER